MGHSFQETASPPPSPYLSVVAVILLAMMLAPPLPAFSQKRSAPKPRIVNHRGVVCAKTGFGWLAGTLVEGAFVSHRDRINSTLKQLRALNQRGNKTSTNAIRQRLATLQRRSDAEGAVCNSLSASVSDPSPLPFSISSPFFPDRGQIGINHSCFRSGSEIPGDGTSPRLAWTNVPTDSNRIVLLVTDEKDNLRHWFITVKKNSDFFDGGLSAGFPLERDSRFIGVKQETNDFGVDGYSGPCPQDTAPHTYLFEAFALRGNQSVPDLPDDLRRGTNKNIIARAVWRGIFSRTNSMSTQTPTASPSPEPASSATPTVTPTHTTIPEDTPPPLPTQTPTASVTPSPPPTSTPTPTPSPTATRAPNTLKVAAGANNTCAFLSTGEVRCWGLLSPPTQPLQDNLHITSITEASRHNCLIDDRGGINCWGDNDYYQLGQNNRPIVAGATDVSVGIRHSCAVLATGTVQCWGAGQYGRLGYGESMWTMPIPKSVVGLPAKAIKVHAGGHHTCALLDSGAVYCWGYNYDGQVGDGSQKWNVTSSRQTAVPVVGLSEGVASVSLGANHSCALLQNKSVKCWGYNLKGQVGDGGGGFATEQTIPVDVVGLESGVVQISAGADHTCALLESGVVKCWGDNQYGKLGRGTISEMVNVHSIPMEVVDLPRNVKYITAKWNHTCAVLTDESIKCWGDNSSGQLGDGTSGNVRSRPVDVIVLNP